MSYLNVSHELLCPWCHRRFTITQGVLANWIHQLKFCVFCAHPIGASEEQMAEQGYERYPAGKEKPA